MSGTIEKLTILYNALKQRECDNIKRVGNFSRLKSNLDQVRISYQPTASQPNYGAWLNATTSMFTSILLDDDFTRSSQFLWEFIDISVIDVVWATRGESELQSGR